MSEHERIEEAVCGCRSDRVTGLRTYICSTHDSQSATIKTRLDKELDEAERKAWESLARYKFQMFGYWAAIWVHLNRLGSCGRKNPWSALVTEARVRRGLVLAGDFKDETP